MISATIFIIVCWLYAINTFVMCQSYESMVNGPLIHYSSFTILVNTGGNFKMFGQNEDTSIPNFL